MKNAKSIRELRKNIGRNIHEIRLGMLLKIAKALDVESKVLLS